MSTIDGIDPIPVIGQIPPVDDLPGSDLAVFLDGDEANLDPDNILDINYFQNAYTYDQFLDDFKDRVYYMERTAILEQTVGRLQATLETQTKQLADLEQRMR
jgi:hypothetical protein